MNVDVLNLANTVAAIQIQLKELQKGVDMAHQLLEKLAEKVEPGLSMEYNPLRKRPYPPIIYEPTPLEDFYP